MAWPAAEIQVDDDLLGRLLVLQFPSLSDEPRRFVAEGFDNYLWRLGDDLAVRLPRREAAVVPLINEIAWLNSLAARLSLRTPAPVFAGTPCDLFAWPWMICQWIRGTPGDELDEPPDTIAARAMGRFLAEMHHDAPPDAPRNPWRSVPLSERTTDVLERATTLDVDDRVVRELWDISLAAEPWSRPRQWLHGDFHPGNMIFADGALVGVVDFGDLCAGDPATDLCGGLLALDTSDVAEFLAAYGVPDRATLARTVGWAVHFGLLMTSLGRTSRPQYASIGRRALANAAHLATLT